MKRFGLMLLALFLLTFFSCDLFKIDHPVDTSNGSLTLKVFPPQQPYRPKPIIVSGIRPSNDEFANKIIIEWHEEEKGVYYTRLFWFENFNEGNAEYEKTLAIFYEEDQLAGKNNYTHKLSRSTNSYEHMDLHNDPNEDRPLLPGKRYFYLIKFYDSANRIVGYSELFFGTTAKIPYDFVASRNIKQADEHSSAFINLTWKWKGEHKGFRIYRKDYENHGATFLPIYTQTDTTPKDSYFYADEIAPENIGKEYLYYITAIVDEQGKESKPSTKVRGTTISSKAPNPPTLFQASKGLYGDLIYLSWQAVSDPEGKPISYKVFYKLTTESLWEEVDTKITEPFFKFIPLPNQFYKRFHFYAVAVNESGASSEPSTTSLGAPFDSGYLIPYPQNFSASLLKRSGEIHLSWAKTVVEQGEIEYKIFKSSTPNEGDATELVLTSENHYDDQSVTDGVLYYYSIQPCNKIKNPTIGSALGTKTLLKNTYGIAGEIPTPQLQVSENLKEIKIDFQNKPTFCKTRLRVSRPQYKPIFVLKPGRPLEAGATASKPASYRGSFDYKCDPNRFYPAFELLKELPVDAIDYTDTAATAGKNRYEAIYLFSVDEIGLTLTSEHPTIADKGYRTISDLEFCLEALRTVNKSQFHLTRIHKTGLSAAGFDSIALKIDQYSAPCRAECVGGCKNKISTPDTGCFHYNAVTSLSAGRVTVPLVYNDYQAYDMIFNSVGTNHQTSVDFSSNGSLTGSINIGGIYPGKIEFDLVISSGVKSGGSYRVTQTGSDTKEFSWDIDKSDVEESIGTI